MNNSTKTVETTEDVIVLDKDGEVLENEYVVVFNKPYYFEIGRAHV